MIDATSPHAARCRYESRERTDAFLNAVRKIQQAVRRHSASWHKPVSRPQKGRLKQSCEYIVWGTKGPVDANLNPVYRPGLYTASQPRKDRVHITQKPVEVMQELVQICPPGGTVLDPFTGSGTTGVAALREGRRFIAVELSEHDAAVAEQRFQGAMNRDDFELVGPEE